MKTNTHTRTHTHTHSLRMKDCFIVYVLHLFSDCRCACEQVCMQVFYVCMRVCVCVCVCVCMSFGSGRTPRHSITPPLRLSLPPFTPFAFNPPSLPLALLLFQTERRYITTRDIFLSCSSSSFSQRSTFSCFPLYSSSPLIPFQSISLFLYPVLSFKMLFRQKFTRPPAFLIPAVFSPSQCRQWRLLARRMSQRARTSRPGRADHAAPERYGWSSQRGTLVNIHG